MKRKRDVPKAQYSINPVPNVVRCGVRGTHTASCVLEARYSDADSSVPSERSADRRHLHPTQQSCMGLLGERAVSTQQSGNIHNPA